MALSSVLMHRNSPATHITATHNVLITHQLQKVARAPLAYQQNRMWKKWTVHVKSKHCFVLCTTYQRPRELKNEYALKIGGCSAEPVKLFERKLKY